jgi:hypothetical protein
MVQLRGQVWLLAAALVAAIASPTPAPAQSGPQSGTGPITADAALLLGPGQFLWADTGDAGPVNILISIPFQRVYVFRGARPIAVSPVSTGAPGNDTPVGQFTILQKNANHRSNLYNDAPMPYMMRLTWGGVALHAGRNPGYPDSHGCVRLPLAFARKLFAITALGARVVVTDEPFDPLAGEAPDYTAPPPLLLAAPEAIQIAVLAEAPPAFGGSRTTLGRSVGSPNR